ncbi:MAG: hypothetical protein KAY37_07820 [Phycisphaerae bacterium]|nr:hypothetical protein [Phycisphaerae bacterium]
MANGSAKNRPAHTVRVGHCKVAVWMNETKNGVMYSAVPVRIYRDESDDGKWQETHSLSGTQLLHMQKALDLAFDWISEQEQRQQSE